MPFFSYSCIMDVNVTLTFCDLIVLDKVYQVSFVLSNTTWKESYLDTSSSDSTALKTKVLQEVRYMYMLFG